MTTAAQPRIIRSRKDEPSQGRDAGLHVASARRSAKDDAIFDVRALDGQEAQAAASHAASHHRHVAQAAAAASAVQRAGASGASRASQTSSARAAASRAASSYRSADAAGRAARRRIVRDEAASAEAFAAADMPSVRARGTRRHDVSTARSASQIRSAVASRDESISRFVSGSGAGSSHAVHLTGRSGLSAARLSSRTASRGSAQPLPRTEARPDAAPQASRRRPVLRAISGRSAASTGSRVQSWVMTSNRSVLRIVIAVVVLVLSMAATLALRTMMVEDSFALSQTQQSVSKLQQDVESDELQLESLDSSLPDKATQLGMQPGSDAVTLDMQSQPTQSADQAQATDQTQTTGQTQTTDQTQQAQ